MAESTLLNKGLFQALYGDDKKTILFETNEVSVTILDGITATKNADKTLWAGGALTYTIVVKNNSGDNLENITLTDMLDPVSTLDALYGVKLNGGDHTYTFVGGLLTVVINTLDATEEATITFKVLKV